MVVMHVLAYSYITTEQNELKASKYSTTNRYHHIYAIFSEFSKHLLIKTMIIVVCSDKAITGPRLVLIEFYI
jgi:hypothetical protein